MAKWLQLSFNLPVYQTFTYKNLDGNFESLVGKRAAVKFGSRNLIGCIISESESLPKNIPVSEDKIKPINRVVDKEPVFGQAQIELAAWISKFYICSFGEALSAILPSGKREASFENLKIHGSGFEEENFLLSEEQKKAISEISSADKACFFYLYGLTGSGKTEVFLQAAENVIKKGKSVIYLVPEIGLTYQVITAAVNRFKDSAAVLHSGLTGSERLNQWMRIKRGEALMIVGARSAVFAPAEKIGLIIIDEEHDGSYKSGASPRYHARQTAMYLASKHNCPLVMGSATPSLEAWNMIQTGKIRLLSLTKRLAGGSLPSIQIENLSGSKGSLTARLIEEIRKTKNMGKQTILFLNRRGFSHLFRCRYCGYEMLCKNCSVPMTFHKKEGVMKCHYCGMQAKPPSACPECNSLDIGYAGFGTEFIEEEVRRTFPDCSVVRLDTDTVTKAKDLENAVSDFREGKIDILLGTQMIAKGLNFPKVRLVGIILADTGLQMPDFRAAERSFALITQAAGRAGRYTDDGLVIIQTLKPEHPSIVCAKDHKYKEFYEYELSQRKLLDFPPFKRLIRLVFRSKDLKKSELAAEEASRILKKLLPEGAEVMGPSECVLSLISGNYRQQLLLRSDNFGLIREACEKFVKGYKPLSGIYIEADTDPVSLM
ncbi:replication restart helicase PriA [Treponema pedis]|uniref:Replication restart protein PriA n=1 Tax=Treponema pedis str. T A4 TaxID=1291379 RepID=S5ZWP5_9SPIR|nr:primosomal protein N' [Treponema pedis]AGT44825.1 primosomal protein N' [Treponema pedis str. T A4]